MTVMGIEGSDFPKVKDLIDRFEKKNQEARVDSKFLLNYVLQRSDIKIPQEQVRQFFTKVIIPLSMKDSTPQKAKELKELHRLTLNLSIHKVKKKGKLKKFTHKMGTFLHIHKRLYFIPKKNTKIAPETLAEIVKNNPAIPEKIRKRLGKKKIAQVSEDELRYAEKMSDRYAKAFYQALAEAEEESKKTMTEGKKEISVEGRPLTPILTTTTPPQKIALRALAKGLLKHCSRMQQVLEEKLQRRRDNEKKEALAEEKDKDKKYIKIREYIDHIARIARSIEEEEDIKESGYITVGSA